MGGHRTTSEQRLRAAVESAPSGLLMVDPGGRIVLVNREIERLFGYPREELLGRPVDVLLPEPLREGHSVSRGEFMSEPRVRAMGAGRDLFGRRKDGSQVPLEIGLTPVVTEEGIFVLSSIVDISARQKAEARFRAAVESSPSGMVMVDASGRIVMVNREVERLFGYDREELLGRSVETLVPERFRGRHPAFRAGFHGDPHARAMGAGRELYGLRRDGTEIPVEIGLNPIETDEGTLVLSSIVDISARKAAERERAQLEDQLRHAQKMEAVGTLAGGIAHDFNNILGAIMGYTELAMTSPVDEQTTRDLNEVMQFSRRGKALVERILAFSRRQEPSRIPLDITTPVEEVARLLKSTVGPDITVQTHYAGVLPKVLADPAALHQVLMNLGMNARHAMPRGGELEFRVGPLYLTDSAARSRPQLREGPHVVLEVRDTGVGMESDVKDRAFEPFFTTKGPGEGSGLGLAMVHGIIHEHQGMVELESAPGEGTRVRCFLPALEADVAEAGTLVGTLDRGNGERVLYVDDEPALAEVGKRRLEWLGFQPVVVTEPERALEMMQADPGSFDLVVTDYLMPRMNGLQLAKGLRDVNPSLAIVLLTGHIHGLPAETLAEAGVDVLIQKPASMEELSKAAREALESARERVDVDSDPAASDA